MEMPTPFTGRNRMKFTKSEYAKGIFGTLLIACLIAGYTFEIRHFSNTFGIKSLILSALGLGLVIGLLVGYMFSKELKNSLEKFQIIVAFVFASLVVMPLLASWVNRGLASSEPIVEPLEFAGQQAFIQSRFGTGEKQIKEDGYYLFFIRNKKIERVTTTKELVSEEVEKGTIIGIPIKKGGLGFDFFIEE